MNGMPRAKNAVHVTVQTAAPKRKLMEKDSHRERGAVEVKGRSASPQAQRRKTKLRPIKKLIASPPQGYIPNLLYGNQSYARKREYV
tara:strand:- start:58 stop:318 length:261 start_codon:yes stop_codon:yes gene_type:complete